MKYAIVTILLWMNSIQLCSSNAACAPDLTGMCNVILDKIPDVFKKVKAIPDILDDVEDVLKMVQQIPQMFEVIMLLLENPFTVTDILPPDVLELAETLETCMDPVIDLLDPFSAIYEALLRKVPLPEIEIPDFIGELPDIDDLIYKAVAFALLPYKEAVDKTCNSILPGAVNVVKNELTGYGRRRRMGEEIRPSDDGICKGKAIEDYCESKPFEWTHDKGGLYEFDTSMISLISMIKDKSHKEEGCNVNVLIPYRIAKFTINMFTVIVEIVLGIFEETVPEEVKNVDEYERLKNIKKKLAKKLKDKAAAKALKPWKTFGKTIKYFLDFSNHILEFLLASANQHNGEVDTTKINAIFNDRIAILHNQEAILHIVKSGLIGTDAKIDGQGLQMSRIEKIEKNIEQLLNISYQQKAPAAKEEVSIRNDEFGLDIQPKGDATSFITITLSMRELYSLVAVTIGFGSLCIIIGIVIGKCCLINVYKTNGGFTPLPKYDYTTSDVEDVSK
eukprot:8552_1